MVQKADTNGEIGQQYLRYELAQRRGGTGGHQGIYCSIIRQFLSHRE